MPAVSGEDILFCLTSASSRLEGLGLEDIKLDAWSHGRSKDDFLDVLALGPRRPGLTNRLHSGCQIVYQLFLSEADLADGDVNVGCLIESNVASAYF